MLQLSFSNVTFTYDALLDPFFQDLSFTATPGWTGIVGPNGSGKTTLLALAEGRLIPLRGRVGRPEHVYVCPQRADSPPAGLDDLLECPDADAGRLVSFFELAGDWPLRWHTLSHGERKRAQIATALWKDADLLLVDEPTNHLDRAARRMLIDGLRRYRGIGLIVSHDRELLDALCGSCLFLDPLRPLSSRAVLRKGGVSEGFAEQEREDEFSRQGYLRQAAEVSRLRQEAERRSAEASVQDRKRSRRGLAPKDRDTRARIGLARFTGKDGVAGRLSTRQSDRIRRAEAKLVSQEVAPLRRSGITVEGEVYKGDTLLRLPAGTLDIASRAALSHPDLKLSPGDRRALVGPNGSGKSSLIRALLPLDGAAGRYLYLPQELSQAEASTIRESMDRLSPSRRGRVLSTLQRLASEPEHELRSRHLSPGEARKLALPWRSRRLLPSLSWTSPRTTST